MYEQMYAETKQEEEADRAKKREKERKGEKERGGRGAVGGEESKRKEHARQRERNITQEQASEKDNLHNHLFHRYLPDLLHLDLSPVKWSKTETCSTCVFLK